MNLIELFEQLSIPKGSIYKFNAIPIPEFPNFRVAINIEGMPVLLLMAKNPTKTFALKNFRLKYIQIEQNILCSIKENKKYSSQIFTVITFTSSENSLQEYFFTISETLIKMLGENPLHQQIVETVDKFVEIFRALGDPPSKTVHGLWTELFLIEVSPNPIVLLKYWHNSPEEKYDFNAGDEKIEVKSNSSFERIHIFSSEQLNPTFGAQVIIASIFIKQHNKGKSIRNLIEDITSKIEGELELIDKMNNLVCKTLGNSLEQSITLKYDYELAKKSLLFYRQQDIYKIEALNIPNEVSEIKYKSDLTKVIPVKMESLRNKGSLFKSL